jgi:lactoylglutathione lyase
MRSFVFFITLACACCLFDESKKDSVKHMELGNFSSSIAVKDIAASKAFYEKLGFTQIAGNMAQNWLVMKNGDTKIGLFQGMFDKNTMTFNPGWNAQGEELESFMDVREIQKKLLDAGIEITTKADPDSSGPAYIALVDPDGNPILIDQHVSKR